MKVTGVCPTLGEKHSIDVEYIPSRTLEGTSYVKERYECDHASYGGKCSFDDNCPIYESAPEYKR